MRISYQQKMYTPPLNQLLNIASDNGQYEIKSYLHENAYDICYQASIGENLFVIDVRVLLWGNEMFSKEKINTTPNKY